MLPAQLFQVFERVYTFGKVKSVCALLILVVKTAARQILNVICFTLLAWSLLSRLFVLFSIFSQVLPLNPLSCQCATLAVHFLPIIFLAHFWMYAKVSARR